MTDDLLVPSPRDDFRSLPIGTRDAPIIYAEFASVSSYHAGIARVTLEAIRESVSNGRIVTDRVPVLHLRLPVPAALALRAALATALKFAADEKIAGQIGQVGGTDPPQPARH